MFLGSSLAVRQSGPTVAPPCLGLPWPPQSQLCTTNRASTAPNYRVLPPRDLLLVASLPKTWFEVSAAGDLGSGMGPPRSRRPANEEGQTCCHLSCRHPSALQSHRQSEQTTLRKQFPSELCGLVSQVRKRCGGARVLSFTGTWALAPTAVSPACLPRCGATLCTELTIPGDATAGTRTRGLRTKARQHFLEELAHAILTARFSNSNCRTV